jgi:hypothetical protein
MSEVFLVDPTVQRIRDLVARAGWRVYTTLDAALEAVDANFAGQLGRRTRLRAPFKLGLFINEVEDRLLSYDQTYNSSALLREDLRDWRCYTREEFESFGVELRMGGIKPRFTMFDVWHRMLPTAAQASRGKLRSVRHAPVRSGP